MVNIVNAGQLGGGFRHYSGLVVAGQLSGLVHRASVRPFHVPATNATAIFRGDIAAFATAGSGDLPQNIAAPGSLLVGNGGGSGLGNGAIAPDVISLPVADTTSMVAGVVVGFGPITLYQAKNGFQYIPANTEAWVFVDTDPDLEMYCTVPTIGSALADSAGAGANMQANPAQQVTRFGISGMSLNPTFNNTNTRPLRVIGSGELIGNDVLSAGYVAKVTFSPARHFRGSAAPI